MNKLFLTIVGARDLLAADDNGKSDPYVKISGQGLVEYDKKHKTSTKKKTLEPTWNESFIFDFNDAMKTITFSVYDHDSCGSDDLIGECNYFIECLLDGNEHDSWEKLAIKGKEKGELHIRARAEYKNNPVKANPTFCDNCEKEEATVKCIHCNMITCEKCFVMIHTNKVMQKHERIQINSSINTKSSVCAIHKNEPFKLFCVGCKQPVCVYCVASTHKGHNVETLTVENISSVLSTEVDTLKRISSPFSKKSTEMYEQSNNIEAFHKEFEKEIEESTGFLLQAVNERKRQLIIASKIGKLRINTMREQALANGKVAKSIENQATVNESFIEKVKSTVSLSSSSSSKEIEKINLEKEKSTLLLTGIHLLDQSQKSKNVGEPSSARPVIDQGISYSKHPEILAMINSYYKIIPPEMQMKAPYIHKTSPLIDWDDPQIPEININSWTHILFCNGNEIYRGKDSKKKLSQSEIPAGRYAFKVKVVNVDFGIELETPSAEIEVKY